MDKVRLGIIGSGFISNLHVNSLQRLPEAEVVAVASPTPGKARAFADEHGIPDAYESYEAILKRDDIDAITVGVPNDLHEEVVVAAAQAGKHVLCDKPLARSLPEGERMMAAVHAAGVKLVYGEMLCFAPKYVRAKKLIQEGALGKVFLVKQNEEHDGPHSPWFWDVNRSGGGALLDMGCHSIEFARWILDRPQVRSVQATMGRFMHPEKTRAEDHSIVVIEFENDVIAIAENSWAKTGGLDDRCEIYGTLGNTRADLVQGVGLRTHSKVGYGYAVEKAGSTVGWSFTGFEEEWTHGFPQEMQHFVNVVLGREEPMETGEDGLEVLRIIYAAYQSAGEGRRIEWPYTPPDVEKPVDLWLNA
ncbi:Gfo/Idh/MocA family protein [Aggregatilinea lenta]|uniref:Gfo/Idh/MocA family protein n=1 Tax=Aggregatilinea lenta TaxID=913108 RepID=UPI000E5A88C4|nr:Gfo/Idh/MocA family oxidoreductase [Aggregatilinea lenta]